MATLYALAGLTIICLMILVADLLRRVSFLEQRGETASAWPVSVHPGGDLLSEILPPGSVDGKIPESGIYLYLAEKDGDFAKSVGSVVADQCSEPLVVIGVSHGVSHSVGVGNSVTLPKDVAMRIGFGDESIGMLIRHGRLVSATKQMSSPNIFHSNLSMFLNS